MILYLNLLPKTERRKIALTSIYSFMIKQSVFLVILFSVVTIGAWQVRGRLEYTISSVNNIFERRKAENAPLLEKVKFLNQTIDQIAKIQSGYSAMSRIIIDFAEMIPYGISITDFVLKEDNTIDIDGVYKNRDDVLRFRARLEAGFLTDIQFPISNLLKSKNGSFSISGILSDEELSKSKL